MAWLYSCCLTPLQYEVVKGNFFLLSCFCLGDMFLKIFFFILSIIYLLHILSPSLFLSFPSSLLSFFFDCFGYSDAGIEFKIFMP